MAMTKSERAKVQAAYNILDKLIKNTIFTSSKIYFAVRDAREILEKLLNSEKK